MQEQDQPPAAPSNTATASATATCVSHRRQHCHRRQQYGYCNNDRFYNSHRRREYSERLVLRELSTNSMVISKGPCCGTGDMAQEPKEYWNMSALTSPHMRGPGERATAAVRHTSGCRSGCVCRTAAVSFWAASGPAVIPEGSARGSSSTRTRTTGDAHLATLQKQQLGVISNSINKYLRTTRNSAELLSRGVWVVGDS